MTNKISLKVDFSYAFDYLSILELKSELCPNDTAKYNTYFECFLDIKKQLGGEKFSEIFTSPEYQALFLANKETFRLVDLAKTDSCAASEVDRMNYTRFLCKKALQEKFFNTPLSESKIGYEKYE